MVLRPKPKAAPAELRVPPPPPSMPPKEAKRETASLGATPPFPPLKTPMASSAVAIAVTHPEAVVKVKPVVQIVIGEEHLAIHEAERLLAETGLYYVSAGYLARLVPTQGSMQCEEVNQQTLYVVLSAMIEWHRQNRNGEWEVCNPPQHLISTLLFNRDRKHLQTLTGIAHQTECLIATVDDTYTYNKRINRLTATQEHRMISRAADRGVSEERLADALGLDVGSIRRRFRMLDGICDAAVEILRDTPCPMAGFEVLRCMAPVRQVEAAQLMVDQNNFSVNFVRALLLATPENELVDPRKKKPKGTRKRTAEDMGRMEREITNLQAKAHTRENEYAEINFKLTFAKTYLEKLLGHPRVARWLRKNHPDYFEQFQEIVGVQSLKMASSPRPPMLSETTTHAPT